jgi:hypothetical protein
MADHRPAPEPVLLQFGLRQLLSFTAGMSVFFAVVAASGTGWRIVLLSIAALVAAHVAGTCLGTRLRDTSSDVQRWKALRSPGAHDDPVATPPPIRLADLGIPTGTALALHESAPRRSHWALAAGALTGSCLGAGGISVALGNQVSWAGYAVGAISCGVIGAWAALLAASFVSIGRRAWKQASTDRPSR